MLNKYMKMIVGNRYVIKYKIILMSIMSIILEVRKQRTVVSTSANHKI